MRHARGTNGDQPQHGADDAEEERHQYPHELAAETVVRIVDDRHDGDDEDDQGDQAADAGDGIHESFLAAHILGTSISPEFFTAGRGQSAACVCVRAEGAADDRRVRAVGAVELERSAVVFLGERRVSLGAVQPLGAAECAAVRLRGGDHDRAAGDEICGLWLADVAEHSPRRGERVHGGRVGEVCGGGDRDRGVAGDGDAERGGVRINREKRAGPSRPRRASSIYASTRRFTPP